MYRKRLILGLIFLWLFALDTKAQVPEDKPVLARSNLRQRVIPLSPTDTLLIDSLSIIPGTFSIDRIAPDTYTLDAINALLVWKKRPADPTITVTYRVFPGKINPVTQRLNFDSISYKFYYEPKTFRYGPETPERGIFDFGNIQYNGSFDRGISFGNSQDAVVNSNLNLTLNGMLGDSIEISAAITDNNLPIQPDGTTQQLNEFDQIYLQFKRKNWQLNLGDIDIRQNQSYFLNFYKRLQGISFQTQSAPGAKTRSKTLVSGSIAKGKFTRNVFQGLEGNQGPYRLTGANNELYFIVLAGTERVFIDGQLLQRGEDQDYVVNYSTAEVTFTPKRMITKDSRIQVEFEYADRNYLNANLYLAQELGFGEKFTLRFGAFNNSDARNSSINQVLSTEQKAFLGTLGDSIQNALYPSAIFDTAFDAGKVLYEKVYFNNGTGLDSFYRYSTDPSVALYNLSFIEVGQGKGDYAPDFNGANGKVFKYIDRISGVKQGNFDPVILLVTPKRQQVFSLGMDYKLSKNTLLKTELAMSRYDPNTFSKVHSGDDQGFAAKFTINSNKELRPASPGRLRLATGFDYEYVQSRFKPLERLRSVEFARDFGLPLNVTAANEQIFRGSARLQDNKNHSLDYRLSHYRRGDIYSGWQQAIQHNANWSGWTFNNQFMLTQFNADNSQGAYLRPVIDLSKKFTKLKDWRLGVNYAVENNTVKSKATDTLTPLSFYFDTYTIYLRSDEQKKNRYGLSFFSRSDKYISAKEFIRGDRSYNFSLSTELRANDKHQVAFNATYRKLKVLNSISPQKEDETVLGRVKYEVNNEFKGLFSGYVLYELGTGQEQRRDLTYLEVPAGQGEFTWNDYNNDGIQQLNEFELAQFTDQAKFIRIFTPTNQFLKANYIQFNYEASFNPRAMFKTSDLKGMKKLLSRLNFRSSFQVTNKSVSKGGYELNPVKLSLQDTSLITLGSVFTNIFSINRQSSVWVLDFTSNIRNDKSLLTYGYESRRRKEWGTRFRWNISPSFQLDLAGKKGENGLFTPGFANRNYDLDLITLDPRLTFLRSTKFKFMTGYRFDRKENDPVYGGEVSISHAITLETKYTVLQNSAIMAKMTVNNIKYDHPTNTTVSYIMLDGLLPGRNFLWTLDYTKRLLNNVELNLQYEGRKPGSARTVHVGRATVRALF